MIDSKKIFVTGVSGSGKTTISKAISAEKNIPYISFDEQQPYMLEKSDYSAEKFLVSLPEAFVVDAIPFDIDYSWEYFNIYEAQNEVEIICVYCPDREVFLTRLEERKNIQGKSLPFVENEITIARVLGWASSPKRIMATFARFFNRVKNDFQLLLPKTLKNSNSKGFDSKKCQRQRFVGEARIKSKNLFEFRQFFKNKLQQLRRFKHVSFYDTIHHEYTSEKEALRRIHNEWFDLEDHLYQSTYDVGYQDIEIIDLIGYSESYKTWENLRREIDWEDKKCVDLGCFHGYFCFRMEDQGATAIGLEKSLSVIETARKINQLRGGNVEFIEWVGGERVPACDVILCLNVLHHFGDQAKQEAALKWFQAPTVIFEINQDQIHTIKKYFSINKVITSHRSKRKILICSKN